MRVTFIDENGGTVTITNPITVEGEAASLRTLATVLLDAVEADQIGVKVRVLGGAAGHDAARQKMSDLAQQQLPPDALRPAELTELPLPWKPWESTVPPMVQLEVWQLDLLRRTRSGVIPIKDIEGPARTGVLENHDPEHEHRLFSIIKGQVAIAPAGLYALDRANAAELPAPFAEDPAALEREFISGLPPLGSDT